MKEPYYGPPDPPGTAAPTTTEPPTVVTLTAPCPPMRPDRLGTSP